MLSFVFIVLQLLTLGTMNQQELVLQASRILDSKKSRLTSDTSLECFST